jgi:hypothetical protein
MSSATSSTKKKILFFPTSLSLHTRARGVAPGPNPGRRFTVRLAVTLPPLIYGAGGSCGIGTPPIRCTHSHHREMDILPCTSPPALLAGPRSAGLRYNFPPSAWTRAPGRAQDTGRGLLGLVRRP